MNLKPLEETDPELATLLMKVCRGEIPAWVKNTTVYEKISKWDIIHGGAYTEFREVTLDAGRNDPCPCGSGKKYKKCCGRGQ